MNEKRIADCILISLGLESYVNHHIQGVVWCQREKIFVVIYSEERYCQLNSGSNLLARCFDIRVMSLQGQGEMNIKLPR
jgi:hypothetical protein